MKRNCAVSAVCLPPPSPHPPYKKEKNGHCSFKKLNCPLGPAERRDWWARRFPLETSWKREPLPRCVWERSLCLASIQKSSGSSRRGSAGLRGTEGAEKRVLSGTYVHSREKQWLRLPADIVRSFFYRLTFIGPTPLVSARPVRIRAQTSGILTSCVAELLYYMQEAAAKHLFNSNCGRIVTDELIWGLRQQMNINIYVGIN